MKTYKKFSSDLQEAKGKKEIDPPAVLVMKRKSIRQFPNGQRIALYYIEKINKYVTIPYENMLWASPLPEEVEE